MDNKLSFYLREDKTKSILFPTKNIKKECWRTRHTFW